jgi:hypothetical protein
MLLKLVGDIDLSLPDREIPDDRAFRVLLLKHVNGPRLCDDLSCLRLTDDEKLRIRRRFFHFARQLFDKHQKYFGALGVQSIIIAQRKRPILITASVLASRLTTESERDSLWECSLANVERVLEYVGMGADLEVGASVKRLTLGEHD